MHGLVSALILSLVASASPADVDPLVPAGGVAASGGTPYVESATLAVPGPSGGLTAAYLTHPLRIRGPAGLEEGVRAAAPLTAHLGWTFGDRARVDLHLPFYAVVDSPLTGRRAPAFGDLQVQAVVRLITASEALTVSLRPLLAVPTGTADALVQRGVHGGVGLLLGGDLPHGFGYATHLGITGAPVDVVADAALGSTFDLGGGGWWRATRWMRVGAELVGSVGLPSQLGRANHVLAAHGFAQATLPSGLALMLGVGAGLGPGVGTPGARVFGSLTWAPPQPDTDGDGVPDRIDACPTEPEDLDGRDDADGCPDPDDDADGVPDTTDRCPTEPEDLDGFEDADGCPDDDNDGDLIGDAEDACPDAPGLLDRDGCPDRDRDGVFDPDDRCPETPGATWAAGCPDTDADGVLDPDDACPTVVGAAGAQGCPDTDADGVPDPRDQCPDEPAPAAEDPSTSDGCPKLVLVEDDTLRLLAPVTFEPGSGRLARDATEVLEALAATLLGRDDLLRLEISGHTDATGSRSANLDLSARRARAVRAYLIEAGVAPARLTAVGFGPDQPRDTNRTERGRAANRRVEVRILERAPLTPAR